MSILHEGIRCPRKKPVYTSIHSSHLCLPPPSPPSSVGNSPGHYFIPLQQHPRWSNHLNNRWRSQSAGPVVLFLSRPVSLIIAKSSIPGPRRLKYNRRAELWKNTNYAAAWKVLSGWCWLQYRYIKYPTMSVTTCTLRPGLDSFFVLSQLCVQCTAEVYAWTNYFILLLINITTLIPTGCCRDDMFL